MRPKVAYGPKHQPFVESIFRRDPVLGEVRRKFESALNKDEITDAKALCEKIEIDLISRIAV